MIKKIAPETDSAQKNKVAIVVALRGAKRPKLAKIMASHKFKMAAESTHVLEVEVTGAVSPRLAAATGLSEKQRRRLEEFAAAVIREFETGGSMWDSCCEKTSLNSPLSRSSG